MFLNLDDFVNVPQYPGYPGFQLLDALIQTYISQVLIFKWMLANHGSCPDMSIITNIAHSVLYEVVGCSWFSPMPRIIKEAVNGCVLIVN